MLRLFRNRLPRLRAGLDWIAHFLFSRVTLVDGAVSFLKCFFLFLHVESLSFDLHLVPHVTRPEYFPYWVLGLVMPFMVVGVGG